MKWDSMKKCTPADGAWRRSDNRTIDASGKGANTIDRWERKSAMHEIFVIS